MISIKIKRKEKTFPFNLMAYGEPFLSETGNLYIKIEMPNSEPMAYGFDEKDLCSFEPNEPCIDCSLDITVILNEE